MIKLANEKDIYGIYGIIKDAKKLLKENGSDQWQDTDGVISKGAAYLKKINEKQSWAQNIMNEKDIYSNGEETLSYFSERLERDGL